MKNFVIITGLFNYPPASGGDLVMLSLFKELADKFHLTVIYPGRNISKEKLSEIMPNVKFIDFNETETWHDTNASLFQNFFLRMKLYFLKRSIFIPSEKYFYYSFIHISQWIKANIKNPNVIQVDFPWMLRIINFLQKDVSRIYVNHEIQFVSNERKSFLNKTLINKSELKNIKSIEIDSINKYDACLTLSEADKIILKQHGVKSKLFFSALGIDLRDIQFLNHQYYNRLVFIGNGNHYPNIDAIEYFVSEILPVIKLNKCDVKLFITGKYPQSFIDNYKQYSELIWTGYVTDLNEVLLNSISIVPIRIGSGIRIKILESMASGCPVVTTNIGIEGIDAENEKEALISDDKVTFANQIVQLLDDYNYAQTIAKTARQFVELNYDIENVTKRRIKIINELLTHK